MRSDKSQMGPWTYVQCQEGLLSLTCPGDYRINIDSGFFGRKNGESTCADAPVSLTECQSTQAVEKITSLCDGLTSCAFNVTGSVFGSPCGSHTPYLNLTYYCELPLVSVMACDDEMVKLDCYNGRHVFVENAMYGRSNSQTCPTGSNLGVTCEAEDTEELMQAMCDNREVCLQMATSATFGEPCSGTSKYLEADYVCAECTNVLLDADCDYWTSQDECESNTQWMYANCRMSCTSCDVKECKDYDKECAYWASDAYTQQYSENSLGECVGNSGFMSDSCHLSCSNCDAIQCVNNVADSVCDGWASTGECDSNKSWMYDNCRKACTMCDTEAYCVDLDDKCDEWKDDGECTGNPYYMRRFCSKACDLC